MNNKTIVYSYEKSSNYTEFRFDSVWGGVTSTGELVFYLCEDVLPLPERLTVFPPSGPNEPPKHKQEPDYSQKDEVSINRVCHARAVVPIKVLPSIIEWLQSQIKEYENIEKG